MQFHVNEADQQFEMNIGTGKALIEYSIADGKVHLTHTEVPEEAQGKGIAAELTKKSLEWIRAQKLQVMPLCSYAQHYLNNHPEFHDLLSDGYQI